MKLSKNILVNNQNNIKFILFSFGIFLYSNTSHAVDSIGNYIGFGLDGEQSIYSGKEYKTLPTPTGNYSYGRFYVSFENGLGIQLGSFANIQYSLSLNYMPYAYQRNDIKELNDMDELDNSINYNLTAATNFKRHILNLNVSKDEVLDKGGISTELTYSYLFTKSRWVFIPNTSITYQDKYLTRYLYGVKQHESTSGRVYYQPDYSINYTAGLYIEYITTKKYSIIGNVNYSKFGTEITNSPIVDRKSTSNIFIGFNYNF